jgi:hypothetical protein
VKRGRGLVGEGVLRGWDWAFAWRGCPGVVGRAHGLDGASPLVEDARFLSIASPESRKVRRGVQ